MVNEEQRRQARPRQPCSELKLGASLIRNPGAFNSRRRLRWTSGRPLIKRRMTESLNALTADLKRLTARVAALEKLLERIVRQKPVSEKQLERALRRAGLNASEAPSL